MENWVLEEDWSISNLADENWCIPEIQEARVKRDKIEREKKRPLKRKFPLPLPLANLSGAELRQEAFRIIVARGLYPEEEIQSAHHRKRQMGCKDKNILTDRVKSAGKADIGQFSGEGITKNTLAKPGPAE